MTQDLETWWLVCPEYQSGVWISKDVASVLLGADIQPGFFGFESLPALKATIERNQAKHDDQDLRWFADQMLSVVADAEEVGSVHGLVWLQCHDHQPDKMLTGTGFLVSLEPDELGNVLRDAWIDLPEAVGQKSQQQLAGWVQRGGLRYRYLLRLSSPTLIEVAGQSHSGGMTLGSVTRSADRLVLDSTVGTVRLTVALSDEPFELRVDAQPFMRRRWGKWKPLA